MGAQAETAEEINAEHTNSAYLKGVQAADEPARDAPISPRRSRECDVLVVGVPSQGFREVLTQAAPHMRPWIPVVSLTKGFERGLDAADDRRSSRRCVPGHPAAALTGPNLAKEIMHGLAAASVMATEDMAVASKLQEVLHLPLFRLYTNDDVDRMRGRRRAEERDRDRSRHGGGPQRR